MSNNAPNAHGPLSIVAILLAGIVEGVTASGQRSAVRQEQRRAEKAARVAERESELQQRKWLETVRRQKARGDAGDATQRDAQDALRGRGGRRSELDDRWF